jgi:NitT/TauT family transport system permease protein
MAATTSDPSAVRLSRRSNVGARAAQILTPLAWGAFFLFAWERFVIWRKIKPFLLPAPSAIWKQLKVNRSGIWETARNTGTNALIGLVVGTIIAVAIAFVAQRFRIVRALIAPIGAALNTMPIVALGPVFYNLFGSTSDTARRVVIGLVAFFPVFVNVLRGLTQVDPTHTELMRSFAATDAQMLRLVRSPNAMPFAMTGIRIAASLSVIAAVVVEYFGGLQNGLGNRAASAMKLSATAKGWAYVSAACMLGLAFFVAAIVLERLTMPWQARRRAAERA